jgi:hypothetical protein
MKKTLTGIASALLLAGAAPAIADDVKVGILLGFSLIMVVMETDLGCVYRNREASEISLFTLT